jgi:hypothetical protein
VLEVSAGLVEHTEKLPDTAAASPSSSSSPAASTAASPLTDVEAAAITTSATKQCDSATLTAGAANGSTMYGSTAPARMTVKRSSLPAPCITSAAAMRHKPRSPSMLEGAPAAAAAAAAQRIPRRSSLLNLLAPPLPEPVYKTSNTMPLWHRRRSLLGARASLTVSPRTLHRGVVQQAQATAELRKARPRYSPSPKAVRSTSSSSSVNTAGIGSGHSRSPAAAAAVPASSAASPLLPLHSNGSPVAKQQQQQQQLCCASVSTDAARNWLRPAVVCCTAAAALLVPDVGLAVALAGSVGGSVLNLVLPPLVELRLETSPSLRQYAVSAVIVAAGVVCGVVGTAQALSAIAESYAKH